MHLRPGIATVSLGRSSAGHAIFKKIEQAKLHGFEGVEIFYECLEHYASSLPGGLGDSNLILAAQQTRKCCDDHDLEVICLQPFAFYDGLKSPEAHKKVIQKLHFWFKLAKILRTDLIQVPTNFLQEGVTGDPEIITADCSEIARLGMQQDPIIRFSYEGISWGTHIDTWDGTWDIVKKVNMPNFGLCLDTFHIAGRVYGDPTSASGINENGKENLEVSLKKMVKELDVKKIFYVQAGDAQKLEPPLNEENRLFVPNQPARMTWSRNSRLFPYENDRGAYLPVKDVLDTIINKLGYRGWVSMETFNQDLFVPDEPVPEQYGFRARRSWDAVLSNLY